MVRWLRLCTSTAGDTGSIPGGNGDPTCSAVQPKEKKTLEVLQCPGQHPAHHCELSSLDVNSTKIEKPCLSLITLGSEALVQTLPLVSCDTGKGSPHLPFRASVSHVKSAYNNSNIHF